MNYDQWLNAPYEQGQLEADKFLDWCERNDLDPDSQDSEDDYNDFVREQEEELAEYLAERAQDPIDEDRWEDDGGGSW